MSKFNKKKKGELPAVNTASLPDIVFMLLFFFMVATVMRDNELKIKNELPAADQVEKLDKKDLVMYIYLGKPNDGFKDQLVKKLGYNLTISLQKYLMSPLLYIPKENLKEKN